MVSCRQKILQGECPKLVDNPSDDEASGRCLKPCNCAKIFGRDHLKSKRARKFRCKSKRIVCLAQPKYNTQKYCVDETASGKPAVEVTRTFEEQIPERIKFLAYPKVRKLVSSRDALKGIVDKQWYDRMERLIQRSMLTMYSKMANVKLPEKFQKHQKWTKADWQRHCEWLQKRAIPKNLRTFSTMEETQKRVPLEDLLESIQHLSRPRLPRPKYRPRCGYQSTVKPTALSYKPTERTLKLAGPKQRDIDDDEDFQPFQVNPNALKFEPSKI